MQLLTRRRLLTRGTAFGVGLAGAGLLSPLPTLAESPSSLASNLRLAILELTNAVRAQYGLPTVQLDPALARIAETRAAAQVRQGGLSHSDEAGQVAIIALMEEAGLRYLVAGENLARMAPADAGAARRTAELWMGSPDHRRNILEPAFNRIGVGVALDGDSYAIFAQVFHAALA